MNQLELKSNPGAAPVLWTARQAADALAVSERTLWAMTLPRGTIPCIRVGQRGCGVRYDPHALQEWIAGQRECAAARGAEKKSENVFDLQSPGATIEI